MSLAKINASGRETDAKLTASAHNQAKQGIVTLQGMEPARSKARGTSTAEVETRFNLGSGEGAAFSDTMAAFNRLMDLNDDLSDLDATGIDDLIANARNFVWDVEVE